jgi:hypothetical protein
MARELEQNNQALDKTANEFDDAEKQARPIWRRAEKVGKAVR